MRAEHLILRAELRGEKKLYILAALTAAFSASALCLVLAIGDAFERSFSASSKTLLGGDVALRQRQRPFKPEELRWLQDNSKSFSAIRVAAALAVAGEQSQMARIKTADEAYPLYGRLELQNGDDDALRGLLAAGADAGGAYPAAVAKDLAELLNLNIGDAFFAAGVSLRIADIVLHEPDPDSRLWMAAPLILTGEKAGAVMAGGEGFLSSHFARIRLPSDETKDAWSARLRGVFPDADWRLRGAQQAMPGLRRFVERMRSFLSLLSLAAVLTAGIGINGAAAAFMRARTRAIAVIKMLGGGRRLIIRVYLKIALLFIIGGVAAGAFAGAAMLFWTAPYLSASLPLQIAPQWPWAAFFKTLFSASAMGAAFVVLPVLRAGRANPLSLFNAAESEHAAPPYSRRDIFTAAAVWIPVFILIPLGWREKTAAAAVLGAAALMYVLALACARLAGTAAKRAPPPGSWGLLAAARSRRQTAAGAASLGVGMALLIAVLNIEGNFAARIGETLQREAPSLYFMGIRKEQQEPLRQTLAEASPESRLRAIPFLRGKIKSIGGRAAEDIDAPQEFRWILNGERGLTWTKNGGYIGASEIVAGALWDKNETRPQASFDAEAAEAFGIRLGDELDLNILGQRMTAVITSFRDINWQSFDINFVVILDGQPFDAAPYSLFGAAFLPPGAESAAKLSIAREYPNITPIAMSGVFDIARGVLENISLLLQAAAAFMLFGAIPAVAAALMDGQRRRIHDAAVLRLLGARTRTLILKGLTEYAALAAAALFPALILGMLAAKFVVETIFDLQWRAQDGSPLLVLCAGLTLFLTAGIASIAAWIRRPPLTIIRNE